MEFDDSFSVAAPVQRVFAALVDLERSLPCVPGARITEPGGEDSPRIALRVRLGPSTITYYGGVEVTRRDDGAHVAQLRVRATQARGRGTADATIDLRLEADGDGTRARVHAEVAVTGRAAGAERDVLRVAAARLVGGFAKRLGEQLATARPQGAVPAGDQTPRPRAEPAPEPNPSAVRGAPHARAPLALAAALAVLIAVIVVALLAGRRRAR